MLKLSVENVKDKVKNMALKYIIGGSGTGKSTYIYEKTIEMSMSNPNKNYIIIVPEQFTMQTQKELVKLHPNHVIMNIDVLSFNRLAYRVFDELGTKLNDVLEETGKVVLVKKLAYEHKDELECLASNINKNGYILELKSLISELYQYNITPQKFLEIIENNEININFKNKAKDVYILYNAYDEFIRERYITSEGVLVKLNEVIEDSKMLENAVFVFDGFTGFTPLQNEILRTILPMIQDAYITVNMDAAENVIGSCKEYELFAMSKKMIAKTNDICKEVGIYDISYHKLENNLRLRSDSRLSFLEQNIFRNNNKKYTGEDTDSIEIYSLRNPRQELEFVASNISKEIRENNRKYKDFAVCTANLEEYKELVVPIFSKYNIPVFVDSKSEMLFNPLIEFIKGAFLVAIYDFSYESVMHFLKSSLTGIRRDDIDNFEIYLQATGIRGKSKYKNDFIVETNNTKNVLDTVNETRKVLFDNLIEFVNVVNNKEVNARDISMALYQLFIAFNVEEQLRVKSKEFEDKNDKIKSSEYEHIFAAIISILDKIVDLVGDEIIDKEEYVEVLKSACDSLKIATIPPSIDSVVIGDIERTRLDKTKVLYLIGVNDGAIPKSANGGGIISQSERLKLKDADVELAPTEREKTFMQKFYLYMIMTKASDKLVITYASKDNKSAALNKSYLVNDLCKMFDLEVTHIDELEVDQWLVTIDSSKKYIANMMRDYVAGERIILKSEEDIDTLVAIMKCAKDSIIENIEEGAFYYHNKETVDKEVYKALIGEGDLKGSVSRLEQYSSCGYRFFLNYYLRLREAETSLFERVDMGNVYHEVLDKFSKRITDENMSWKDIDRDTRDEFLDDACTEVYTSHVKTGNMETSRDSFVLYKMKKTLSKTIDSLVTQVKEGLFEPKGFEVSLDTVCDLEQLRVKLEENQYMRLNGIIDRYDEYNDNDGNVYIKIIDYKTSEKKIDWEMLYNGGQLQLIYYMDAVVKGKKNKYKDKYNVKPGAMFYVQLQDPIVKEKDIKNTLEEAVRKQMRPNGLFVSDVDDLSLVKALDSVAVYENLSSGEGVESLNAPFKLKKDNTISKGSKKYISEEEFELVSNHVREKIVEHGRKIASGEIDSVPLKKDSCDYCPYGNICGFDIELPGYKYGDFVKIRGMKDDGSFSKGGTGKDKEVLARLKGEFEDA